MLRRIGHRTRVMGLWSLRSLTAIAAISASVASSDARFALWHDFVSCDEGENVELNPGGCFVRLFHTASSSVELVGLARPALSPRSSGVGPEPTDA